MNTHARRGARVMAASAAVALASALAVAAPAAAAPVHAQSPAAASVAPLTELAHLEFLLDEATPPADVPGHTTYRLDAEPSLVMPWTYADARPGGTFERVGGGPLDPATGHWGQGAYNADDISRAAVVYLRHWQQTDAETSRDTAYELLRSLAYLQTADGPNAGNVVLWMQPDGTLNPSAEPVELPDPSDSGPSYWLARTVWAFGEGYAAFQDADPEFAAFLEDRLGLAVAAIDRQVLSRYGEWAESDGMRVPAWLIVDGADASAEAVLGLAARVRAMPDDAAAADALRKLAEGIAAMSAGDVGSWPYGAVLPWAQSRSMWHGWGSQMPAALAAASVVLEDPALAEPAARDAALFTTTLLTAGGPDNGWFPTPADRVQIAYGADSRVQSLVAVADATGSTGFADLAAMQAAWFFGANPAGTPMYDPATGVTFDGIQPDGGVNRNSGAESTIHGLLTMLALDARPDLAVRATTIATVSARDGLSLVEAESSVDTTGVVSAPVPWTGESLWSGGALTLTAGTHAVFDLGAASVDRSIEPVVWSEPGAESSSTWRTGHRPLGDLDIVGPDQGISPSPGVLLPHSVERDVPAGATTVRVDAVGGSLMLDALIVRPAVSRLVLSGEGSTELVHSTIDRPQPVRIGESPTPLSVRVYDASGALVRERGMQGGGTIVLPAGGFAIAQS
ncbi:hypothetical protein HF576_09585 [Microbacterium sp. CFH 90308]|uniref:Uncharacterized protein n=1 Tax=Microbacterium salsuginis TaxID=2722803 RepID=A0ABX1KAP3_9MICO|nr:hypothetical protein [Microbacterium sp. CFH 90308]NLP84102.1 hypothetical protein [Microbacterium sp. CFH 90308]